MHLTRPRNVCPSLRHPNRNLRTWTRLSKTRRGKMRGSFSSGVITFKGIPYTAPPFDTNRLRPPRPPKSWSGVRDALAFGPKPPQVAYPPGIAERPARRPSTTAVGSPATASRA
jgi:hypothetical protein